MTFLRDLGPSDRHPIEQDMLDELYRQMVKVVRHKLYRKSDVGDVVQEAWVRILEKMDTLRDSDKLIPWAKTIAFNLASNANRARRTSRSFDGEEDYRAAAPSNPNPDLLMELSELLGKLDPTTRTLILYKFYYGFSDDELAAAFEVPVGTIKSRIHRGRARLKAEDQDESTHT